MDKRHLHHLWTRLRSIKPWYFLLLAVLSGLVCVLSLRANNQHMLKLKSEVFAADAKGSDVIRPLKTLQAYVTSHMNTDLSSGKTPVYPPIQLQHSYERLKTAQAEQFSKANSQLYNDAQHFCEQQNPTDFSGRNRVPCIEQYVKDHSTLIVPAVPEDLYKFSFASPRWSSDLAGWSLLATIASGVLFVATFAGNRLLKSLAN